MSESYVVNHQGCYRLVGTRVSLDSIVYAFLDGDTPETILQSFPVLTLEQVYGALDTDDVTPGPGKTAGVAA